jgi:hypothetical protein
MRRKRLAGVQWLKGKTTAVDDASESSDVEKLDGEGEHEVSEEEQDQAQAPLREHLSWMPPSADTDFWGQGANYMLPPLLEREVEREACGELPIDRHRAEILETIRRHPVVVIRGETGSGKSTRPPRFLLEDDTSNSIAVGEPRVLAARLLASRVAAEMEQPLGQSIGYSTGRGKLLPCKDEGSLVYATHETIIQNSPLTIDPHKSFLTVLQITRRSEASSLLKSGSAELPKG